VYSVPAISFLAMISVSSIFFFSIPAVIEWSWSRLYGLIIQTEFASCLSKLFFKFVPYFGQK
jgi:hypothetical protein